MAANLQPLLVRIPGRKCQPEETPTPADNVRFKYLLNGELEVSMKQETDTNVICYVDSLEVEPTGSRTPKVLLTALKVHCRARDSVTCTDVFLQHVGSSQAPVSLPAENPQTNLFTFRISEGRQFPPGGAVGVRLKLKRAVQPGQAAPIWGHFNIKSLELEGTIENGRQK
jgi:hypothetical protein